MVCMGKVVGGGLLCALALACAVRMGIEPHLGTPRATP